MRRWPPARAKLAIHRQSRKCRYRNASPFFFGQSDKRAIAALENKSGKYVEATPQTGANTLASVELPANLRTFITDPKGPDSYPIVTYTWLLAYKKYPDAAKAKALKDFVNWGLTDGQKFSDQLGYIPLPQAVVTRVKAAADQIQ